MPSRSALDTACSLQSQLDEITANTRALVQPERLARTEQMIAEVAALGLEHALIKPGAAFPPFALISASGKIVRSADLLALGPLVLKFFRGRWCPYDMTELEAWEALQPALRERRALFVAVSPQSPRQNAFTAERHHLTFPVLSDPHCALARACGLAYAIAPEWQRHYRSMLVNLPFLHGDEDWTLPVPATLILAREGKVIHVQAFTDPRRRPEPHQVLALVTSD